MKNNASIDGNGNVIIQNADKSEIIINMDNSNEIKKFLIDYQQKLDTLPSEILKLMLEKNTNDIELKLDANIYLGLNLLIASESEEGISFGITITNLTRENRFFNAPFFKFSVTLDGSIDTFSLTEAIHQIHFPKKLEYGEVVSQAYLIRPPMKSIFEKAIAIDSDATILAIASTTIGEIYKSNEYKVSQLLENFKYAR